MFYIYYKCTDVSANNLYQSIKAIYFTIGCRPIVQNQPMIRTDNILSIKRRQENMSDYNSYCEWKIISVEFIAIKINMTLRY